MKQQPNPSMRFAVAEWHVSPWEAHVSRALLESEGVPVFLQNEHHVTVNWPMARMLGGVRLMVPVEYMDAVRAIFDLRDRGDLEAALAKEFPLDVPSCSVCGVGCFFREARLAGNRDCSCSYAEDDDHLSSTKA